jgi:hypothetical protein
MRKAVEATARQGAPEVTTTTTAVLLLGGKKVGA